MYSTAAAFDRSYATRQSEDSSVRVAIVCYGISLNMLTSCALMSNVAFSSLVFFFSSRRRHTRLQGDWSSDVCSSDLQHDRLLPFQAEGVDAVDEVNAEALGDLLDALHGVVEVAGDLHRERAVVEPLRSEERRVGKECRSRWSPYH